MIKEERWKIRMARLSDVDMLIDMIQVLIVELRGTSEFKLPESAKQTAVNIIEGRLSGVIFIAETKDNPCIRLVTISVQSAVHIGSRYALIQELWVHPGYRNLDVGSALIEAIENHCKEYCIKVIEVCLPRQEYLGFDITHSFYNSAGFSEVGLRMRKGVSV